MNTSKITIVLTSILALAILANINVGSIYATGNLDDEEEEAAIEDLQTSVEEIKDSIGLIELNLTAGLNNIEANCPVVIEEPLPSTQEQNLTEQIIEIVENVTEQPEEQEAPAPECPLVPEEEIEEESPTNNNNNNQSSSGMIPPFVETPNEEQNNNNNQTETPIEEKEECQPIPPEEQNNNNETEQEPAAVLEPIICPTTGDLLGYTNTTSGEQLPVSAGNQTTTTEEEVPNEEQEQEQESEPEPAATPIEEKEECQPIPEEEVPNEEPAFNTECFCYQLNEQTGELNVNSTSTKQ